jgi:chromosome segregation ATPase
MKQIAIGIAAVLLIVSGVLYMRDRGARERLLVARTEITNLSNRVEEARAALEKEEAAKRTAESNLLARAQQMVLLTSKVDRASSALEKTERSLAASQAQATEKEQRLVEVTGQNAQLRQAVEQFKADATARETEVSQLTDKLAASEEDRKNLLQDLQKAQVQNTQLLLQLNDPALLRAQMAKLRKQYLSVLYATPVGHPTETQAAGAAPSHGGGQIVQKPRPPGGKGKLQLEPDGSVSVLRGN